jgi:hypothetical protein
VWHPTQQDITEHGGAQSASPYTLAFSGRLDFNPYADALTTPDGKEFRFQIPQNCPALPPSGWDIDDSIFQAPKARRRSLKPVFARTGQVVVGVYYLLQLLVCVVLCLLSTCWSIWPGFSA